MKKKKKKTGEQKETRRARERELGKGALDEEE